MEVSWQDKFDATGHLRPNGNSEDCDEHSSGWVKAGFYMTTQKRDVLPGDPMNTQKWCRNHSPPLKIALTKYSDGNDFVEWLYDRLDLTDEEFTAEVYAQCITGEVQIMEV